MRTIQLLTIGFLALLLGPAPGAEGQGTLDKLEKELGQGSGPPLTTAESEAPAVGYLGLQADEREVNSRLEVFVKTVVKGSPAEESGLNEGDIITSIDGRKITDLDVMDTVALRPAGTQLEFEVRRGDAVQKILVTVGVSAPNPPALIAELPPPADSLETPDDRPILGISVVNISERVQRRFGIVVNSGAVIIGIREGTPATRVGLPLGAVIVSLDGKRIGTADDFVTTLRTYKPGEEVELTYFEGDRVGRKKVRLGMAAPPVPRAPQIDPPTRSQDPPLRLGAGKTDSFALKRLEESLETGLQQPPPPSPESGLVPELPTPPPPPDEAAPPAAMAKMQSQIELLQGQIETLQRRINDLERRLLEATKKDP